MIRSLSYHLIFFNVAEINTFTDLHDITSIIPVSIAGIKVNNVNHKKERYY